MTQRNEDNKHGYDFIVDELKYLHSYNLLTDATVEGLSQISGLDCFKICSEEGITYDIIEKPKEVEYVKISKELFEDLKQFLLNQNNGIPITYNDRLAGKLLKRLDDSLENNQPST